MLIDRARTDVVEGQFNRRVYAFVDVDGPTRVKRVTRPDPQTLILMSDNLDAPPPDVRRGPDLAALRIIGEVVWSGHTWR